VKTKLLLFAVSFAVLIVNGQGFIYDQQSADESSHPTFDESIQSYSPGQSFTPQLSSVGFISLQLVNASSDLNNSTGATVFIELRNSPTGTVLATSSGVFIPINFGLGISGNGGLGFTNFFFPNPVSVTPSVTYYFDMTVQPQSPNNNPYYYNPCVGIDSSFNYLGGTAFSKGTANSSEDLWFREGIIVPEPSISWLVVFSSGILFYIRRTFRHFIS
jgi:hypothetical protein